MDFDIKQIIEIIGYIGSALVIVSMLMTSVVKLRVINIIGSLIFAIYSQIIHSYPTVAMQYCLIVINIVNLCKLYSMQKEYSIVKLDSSEKFVQTFLSQNINDIKKFFPDFEIPETALETYYIYSNNNSVGILIGKPSPTETGSLEVLLDYTTPAYRDTTAGKFLYSKLGEMGIKTLKATASCKAHQKYLEKMNFKKEDSIFIKQL